MRWKRSRSGPQPRIGSQSQTGASRWWTEVSADSKTGGKTRWRTMFDKFHDECGVFAIYGNPEAAKLSHLGLFALQHRGQESAGIAASDGREIRCIKSMGHVAEIFTPPVLKELPGDLAIGHTRYSTAGDTVLLNAHPFSVARNKCRIQVPHNVNILNASQS